MAQWGSTMGHSTRPASTGTRKSLPALARKIPGDGRVKKTPCRMMEVMWVKQCHNGKLWLVMVIND